MRFLSVVMAALAMMVSTLAHAQDMNVSLPPGALPVIDMNDKLVLRLDGLVPPDQQLALFLNGTEIKNVTARPYQLENNSGWEITFFLDRDATNEAAWGSLLSTRTGWTSSTMPVSVSVGAPNGNAAAAPLDVSLRLFQGKVWMLGVVMWALLTAVIVWLARTKGILRDPVPAAWKGIGPLEKIGVMGRPCSLARSQLALWTIVVPGAYVFLVAATGNLQCFSDDALVLMGIATATTLGAGVIDSSKKDEAREQEMEAARTAYLQGEAALRTAGADPSVPSPAMVDALKTLRGTPHENLLTDILTDGNTISIHRLQTVVWTIILAVIFLVEVRSRLAMPVFGPTLLTLMGISNGAYLGFKMPEKP